MHKANVSVLITFYNQVNYVDQALQSVMSQKTNFNYNVVIGDDGSNDGTYDKLLLWRERYPDQIKIIIHERDKKKKYIGGMRASANRLTLLKHVDTEYFIFLDGDDFWTNTNKLQIQFDILNNPKNDDCVGCSHQIEMYYEGKESTSKFIPSNNVKEGKYELKNYWKFYYFHTDTILFRSKFIRKLPMNLIEDFFNDNYITYVFMNFGKIYYKPLCLCVYRQNKNGIWAGQNQKIKLVRELIAYDMEIKFNPSLKNECNIRHLSNLKLIRKNHDILKQIDNEYYLLAKKNHCKTAINAIQKGHLFTKYWIFDNIYISKINIEWIFFRIIRKIFELLGKVY